MLYLAAHESGVASLTRSGDIVNDLEAAEMLSDFWLGVIIIIVSLEIIRIGLSAYVLIHIFEHRTFRRVNESKGQMEQGINMSLLRSQREALVSPTLVALREAMDEVARDNPGVGVDRAIHALRDYAVHLEQEARI